MRLYLYAKLCPAQVFAFRFTSDASLLRWDETNISPLERSTQLEIVSIDVFAFVSLTVVG